MDLYKAIQELYAEKEKLERVIASLEELQRTGGSIPPMPKPAKRRGRKSMSPSERQQVSERMRKYWAGRRDAEKPVKAGISESEH
ncbi:MAG TPA: hypothetical protein VMH28_08810 [Candidatus Acidoferrales bacterium]|nr:hypothetical protein [Candidatus Acidoferrales bacterium]